VHLTGTLSFSYGPVFPTASLVGVGFFFSYHLFPVLFFPFLAHTHTHKALFIFRLALSVYLPPDFLYFYFILVLIPFPGSQAGGAGWGVCGSFQYHCFETNLLGIVTDNQMLAVM